MPDFQEISNVKMSKCDLLIDRPYQFLEASPDGITYNHKNIVEVKCPYSSWNTRPDKGIARKRFPFWKKGCKQHAQMVVPNLIPISFDQKW